MANDALFSQPFVSRRTRVESTGLVKLDLSSCANRSATERAVNLSLFNIEPVQAVAMLTTAMLSLTLVPLVGDSILHQLI